MYGDSRIIGSEVRFAVSQPVVSGADFLDGQRANVRFASVPVNIQVCRLSRFECVPVDLGISSASACSDARPR